MSVVIGGLGQYWKSLSLEDIGSILGLGGIGNYLIVCWILLYCLQCCFGLLVAGLSCR